MRSRHSLPEQNDLTPIFQAIEEDLKSQYLLGFYIAESSRDNRRHDFSVSTEAQKVLNTPWAAWVISAHKNSLSICLRTQRNFLTSRMTESDQLRPIRRALISVSDKTGIVDFAHELSRFNVEIISTGGTAKTLRDAGINGA